MLCRVFEKTKVDGGDGQDSDSAFSPPVFAGSSRVEPPPEPDHSASSGGGCYGYLPSQQQEVAVLPQNYYYDGGGADLGGLGAGRPAAGRPVLQGPQRKFSAKFFAEKPLPPRSGAAGIYFCKFRKQIYIFVKNENKK